MPFFGLKNVVLHPVVHRACHRTANHNILYASCPEPQHAVLGPEFTAYLARVNKILKMVSQAVATTDDSTVYASIATVENFPRRRCLPLRMRAAITVNVLRFGPRLTSRIMRGGLGKAGRSGGRSLVISAAGQRCPGCHVSGASRSPASCCSAELFRAVPPQPPQRTGKLLWANPFSTC
jgi:hypothetical protein